MKILLFGEYSGLFNNLKDGLLKLGHDVFLASDGNLWKQYPSDFRWDTKPNLGKLKFPIQMSNIFLHKEYFVGYDVVLLIAPTIFSGYTLPNKLAYNFLKKHNGKVYLSGAGMTGIIFDYWYEKEYEKYHSYVSGYLENLKSPKKCMFYQNKKLKKWEDKLLNNVNGYIPIWYEYAQPLREFSTLKNTIPIPINVDVLEYKPNIIKNKIVFFHGKTSRPGPKGEKYIIGAFDKLRDKYSDVADFLCEGGLPFAEYIQLLDRQNVVLDDANSCSLGMNALSSMAKGKIVMGGAEQIANEELGYNYNPAINLQPDINQIAHCIEYIIAHKSDLEEMGYKSRMFVEEHHNYIKVAQQYIDIWGRN